MTDPRDKFRLIEGRSSSTGRSEDILAVRVQEALAQEFAEADGEVDEGELAQAAQTIVQELAPELSDPARGAIAADVVANFRALGPLRAALRSGPYARGR